jgi:gluconokinase
VSLLCFDISSSGITAGLLNSSLEPIRLVKAGWTPAPTFSLETIAGQFKQLTRELTLASAPDPIVAISIGSFLHSFVLLDAAGRPLTSVSTWLDSRGEDGVQYVRSQIGDSFYSRTGCRYHPMFPIFKLAALHLNDEGLLPKAALVVSIKSFFVHMLTGFWVEDHGMASSIGLYNVVKGEWDAELLNVVGVSETQLPPVQSRTDVIGRVAAEAARELGLPDNAAVINGSGDGFLANVGSECEVPARVSVTLGTSAAARQTVANAVLNASSGTFRYKAADDVHLLGRARNTAGHVLDWGRSIFGTPKDTGQAADVPIFIPLLHGERSPDWNPQLTGSWHSLMAKHTAADLSRSILEGVVFNLAHFVEIVQNTSAMKASDVVLSGNGFLDPHAAPILATIVDAAIWLPSQPGLASLRGSSICALRALAAPVPSLKLKVVQPLVDKKIRDRYRHYRSLRSRP